MPPECQEIDRRSSGEQYIHDMMQYMQHIYIYIERERKREIPIGIIVLCSMQCTGIVLHVQCTVSCHIYSVQCPGIYCSRIIVYTTEHTGVSYTVYRYAQVYGLHN